MRYLANSQKAAGPELALFERCQSGALDISTVAVRPLEWYACYGMLALAERTPATLIPRGPFWLTLRQS